MEFELTTILPSVLGLIGVAFAKWVEYKTKTQMGADRQLNAQLHQQLVDQIAVLKLEADCREIAFRELEYRYESLRYQYEDLKEAHRTAEESNRQLRDRLLMHYLDGTEIGHTLPPPPAVPRELLEYAKGK